MNPPERRGRNQRRKLNVNVQKEQTALMVQIGQTEEKGETEEIEIGEREIDQSQGADGTVMVNALGTETDSNAGIGLGHQGRCLWNITLDNALCRPGYNQL